MIGLSVNKTIDLEWRGCALEDGLSKEAKSTYFAYRNIHKGKGSDNHHLSLKNKKTGHVEKRGQNFIMKDVTFKVSDKGRERVRSEKRKNVHAGVVGSTYTGNKTKDINWERVNYNPYKNNYFTDAQGKRIDEVNYAKLTPNGVFIPDLKYRTKTAGISELASLGKEYFPTLLGMAKLRRAIVNKMSNPSNMNALAEQIAKKYPVIEKPDEIPPIVPEPDDLVAQAASEIAEKTAEFKSKAQRRKFYALKAEGKMDQKTIDEWESDTKNKKSLPEKVKKKEKTASANEAIHLAAKRLNDFYNRVEHPVTMNKFAAPRWVKEWLKNPNIFKGTNPHNSKLIMNPSKAYKAKDLAKMDYAQAKLSSGKEGREAFNLLGMPKDISKNYFKKDSKGNAIARIDPKKPLGENSSNVNTYTKNKSEIAKTFKGDNTDKIQRDVMKKINRRIDTKGDWDIKRIADKSLDKTAEFEEIMEKVAMLKEATLPWHTAKDLMPDLVKGNKKLAEVIDKILATRVGTPEYSKASNAIRDIVQTAKSNGASSSRVKNVTKNYVKPSLKTLNLAGYHNLNKIAGGPGSGISGDNTKKIDMPLTEYITIMRRTKFMNSHKPFAKDKKVSMSKIKYVGQEKYVPKKLQKFIDGANKGETWMFEKPIDLTIDKEGNYHVLDGHHRFLVAKHFGKKFIKANVYLLKNKDIQEIQLEKVAFNLSSLGKLTGIGEKIGPAITRAPGAINKAFQKGKQHIQSGQWKETAKDLGKGTYNMMAGGKTINGKWDPLYGAKSLGRARKQYTSGPLKGMYKYDGAEHAIDLGAKRNWKGYINDEFRGGSRTRGDLMAKQMAKKKDMNVGDFLNKATNTEKNQLGQVNQMKAMEFMKKHPKLAANYYGRNIAQKGLTVGFPAMTLHDISTGANQSQDPNSSKLGNNLGSLAESAGWALTGPLGLAGAMGAVTGLKSGAKAAGNLISKPENTQHPLPMVQSPMRSY